MILTKVINWLDITQKGKLCCKKCRCVDVKIFYRKFLFWSGEYVKCYKCKCLYKIKIMSKRKSIEISNIYVFVPIEVREVELTFSFENTKEELSSYA